MKFSDIKTADQLLSFQKIKRHHFYHHFTKVSALNSILKGQQWLLSPATRMNDLHECTVKGDLQKWKRIVSTCFSFGDEDNMAMWAMYGLPWTQGVRITIPGRTLCQWFSALQDPNWQSENNVECVSLHDIVYYDGYVDHDDSHLLWSRGKCKVMKDGNTDISKSERFTGYVKNAAWKQESETRLMVVLKEDSIGDFYIPIPETVLSRFEICLGPMVDEDSETVLSQILNGVNSSKLRNAISKNLQRCFFQNKLHLKSMCDYCKNQFNSENDYA